MFPRYKGKEIIGQSFTVDSSKLWSHIQEEGAKKGRLSSVFLKICLSSYLSPLQLVERRGNERVEK